jgi:hypothetical protein
VEPVAAALELVHVATHAASGDQGRGARRDRADRAARLYQRPRLLAHLYRPRPGDDPSKHHYPLDTTIGSPAELDAALAAAATAIATQAPAFFAASS